VRPWNDQTCLFRSGRYLTVAFAIIAVILIAAGCNSPYDKDAVVRMFDNQTPPAFKTYREQNRTIHYAEVGQPGKPLIVFIHGTPGSWQGFAGYLADPDLNERAHLISVDRPGFGNSGYKNLVLSLERQAMLLRPVLELDRSGCGAILVGHSLGAPLAARIAMDYPALASALVLVAPSLDPELENPRWYNHAATYDLVRWAVPTPLLLANKEVMHLQHELRQMLPLWKLLKIPVVVIQGSKDELVIPANADFAERMLHGPLKTVRVPQAGHFILWENPEIVKNEISMLLMSRDNLLKQGCAYLDKGF
jgi:pimeloyl-ACP methyl ester carboxylesterase